jgi:hypothetical protein
MECKFEREVEPWAAHSRQHVRCLSAAGALRSYLQRSRIKAVNSTLLLKYKTLEKYDVKILDECNILRTGSSRKLL